MSADELMSRRDLAFLLHEWLDIERLTSAPVFAQHDRETFDSVLELSETIAVRHFAPVNRILDAQEPYVGDDGTVVLPDETAAATTAYAEAGLGASTFPEELGGMQLPFVVHQAASMWFYAGSVSAYAYAMLAAGNANLLVAHGTDEQVRRFAVPVIEGRWHGTMCLSEPQAGSSLADVTTKAVRQDDGDYRLFGTKMWISGGDHELSDNIVHLVLARVPGSRPGVKGLSLFIVPKRLVAQDGTLGERNDVALVGLNHKMGYRGTTNTLLNFGEGFTTPGGRPGAVGHLVGEEGQGLAAMFHMMNEARVAVGAGAAALGYTGYLRSLAYARTRTQGRPLDAKDPSSPPVALVAHPDVRRMLLAQKAYAEGATALILYAAHLVDQQAIAPEGPERDDLGLLLDVLTPIAKSWPSQWGLAANDLAIQVHGGYGYTRDYAVEQLYRDNRLNPIHEGTHGIQGLDLLGRKVLLQGGRGLQLLLARIRATAASADALGDEPADWARLLTRSADRLEHTTATLWGTGDPALALANATAYLEAAGHLVVAWLWLDQAVCAHDRSGPFYDGKRAAARYFFRHELPKTDPMLDLLDALDRTTLDVDPAVL